MTRPSVYCAVPTYQGQADFDMALRCLTGTDGRADLHVGKVTYSHPEHAFNELWVQALNRRVPYDLTHFAMLHTDVVPEPYWLDKLLAILEEHDADMVSVVIPLKDTSGLTSTATDEAAALDGPKRRPDNLTLRQAHRLPETFGAEAFPGRVLLCNTGCFVCRFDRDWNAKVYAKASTWIGRHSQGGFAAFLYPSDWDWSLQLAKLGCKVLATRAVECYHGRPEFSNASPYGAEDAA